MHQTADRALDLNKAKPDPGQPMWRKTKIKNDPNACTKCKKEFMAAIDRFLP